MTPLEKRVKDLEDKIKELEARPVMPQIIILPTIPQIPYVPPYPIYPQPYIPWQWRTNCTATVTIPITYRVIA